MRKVLLVDDDPDMLELLSLSFQDAGFTVFTAATGMQALHQARRRLPEVIVLDILLPDLDGLSVCEILRRQPSTARIPVLIVTGLTGQLSRFAGLESGADDYIVKPISPVEVVRRVTGLAEKTASGPGAARSLGGESGPLG